MPVMSPLIELDWATARRGFTNSFNYSLCRLWGVDIGAGAVGEFYFLSENESPGSSVFRVNSMWPRLVRWKTLPSP